MTHRTLGLFGAAVAKPAATNGKQLKKGEERFVS